jgi:hypothetical protein
METPNRIDDLTKRQLLHLLWALPPGEYLAYCDTNDQQAHFFSLKKSYFALGMSLDSFWSGQQLQPIEGVDMAFLKLLRTWYLRYYELILDGWSAIKAEFVRRGVDLDPYAKSPGEAFIRTLEDECAAMFSSCVASHHQWSPRQDREWKQLETKIAMATDPEKKQALQKKFDAIERQRIEPLKIYSSFKPLSIYICREASKKDRTLKPQLRSYELASSELDAYVQSSIHPRKARRGHTWGKGIKTSN